MKYEKVIYKGSEYSVGYKDITLSEALAIDSIVRDGKSIDSAIYETVNIEVKDCNGTIVFKTKETESINYLLMHEVLKKISTDIGLTKEDELRIKNECDMFIAEELDAIPFYLLTALEIAKGNIKFSYTELKDINSKEYESIVLASNLLKS